MGKNKKIKLNKLHYHEALDRASLVGDIIDRSLYTHPVIQQNKKLRKKIGEAMTMVFDVYQELGEKL